MYDVVRKTQRFNMDDSRQREEYDEILNDPLCSIIDVIQEKLTEKDFGEEGKLIGMRDYIMKVVTWERKELL